MTDMSAIPPAMTDMERTERAARLLRRIGVIRAAAALPHPGRGGDVDKGSRHQTRSIVPHSDTQEPNQQGAIPMVEGSRVVMVMEDVADHCAWARLDNGLDLMIEYRELAHAPHLLIDRFEWRRLNPIGIASVLLGLTVPEYGIGGIAR